VSSARYFVGHAGTSPPSLSSRSLRFRDRFFHVGGGSRRQPARAIIATVKRAASPDERRAALPRAARLRVIFDRGAILPSVL